MNLKYTVLLITVFLVFFSFPPVITYDSSHYINYVHILEDPSTLNLWDPVRGPMFPFLLFLIKHIFGFSPQIFLAIQFILYIFTFHLLIKLNHTILKKKVIFISSFLFLFNPILIGYFHSVLTEIIAIPLLLLTTIFSLKILNTNKNINKNIFIKNLLISSTLSVFTWQLKQPYYALFLFQFLILVSMKLSKKENILFPATILLISLLSVVISNHTWNKIIQTTKDHPRSSQGLISRSINDSFKVIKDKGISVFIRNTFKNYLAIANFYEITFDKQAKPITTNKIHIGNSNENNLIGLRFLSDSENIIGGLGIIPEKQYSSYLQQINTDNYFLKDLIKKPVRFFNYFFTLSIILLPFITIYSFLTKQKILFLITGSSFLFLFMFAILSAQIDRYAIPIYPLLVFSISFLSIKTVTKK